MNQSEEDVNNNKHDFYPFYVYKRRNSSRRRSSLQSLQHRHRFRSVRRLVRKSGKTAIHRKVTSTHSYRYFRDFSNTLINSSWLWTLVIVSLAFIITWFMFAGLWAVIALDNDDLQNGNTSELCIGGVYSFAGFLLFSIETQSTIGYGGRYITDYCPEAILLLCVQVILGMGICGSLICIVYLKMVAPIGNKHAMVCFSKSAVISQRDGELCLIIRVRDYGMRFECNTNIVAYLVENKNGELSMKLIKLEPPGLLIWPIDIVHRITKTSPLWDLSAKDLIIKRFEIIVVMEGCSLATSSMSRTITSFLSREIKWGHRFKECVTYDKKLKKFIVNHKMFNKTEESVTPLCSAQRLKQVLDDVLTITNYSDSVKFSSPSTMSPLLSGVDGKSIKNDENFDNSDSSDEGIQIITKADVHLNVDEQKKLPKKDDATTDDNSSSEDEEYTTFMDLSIEDLTERNVRTYSNSVSGRAKDMLSSLQKFVADDNTKRLHNDENYKETAF